MNKTSATTTALLGLALLGWGCGGNDARDPAPEVPADSVENTIDVAEPSDLADRERELALRETALEERERALALPVEPEPTVVDPEPFVPIPEEEPAIETPPLRTSLLRLPASTPIEIEFEDWLSSDTNLVGDGFRATVVRDVLQDGLVALPAGSEVFGTVSALAAQKKIGGQERLSLSFDRIELPSGRSVAILARYDAEGRSQKKKDAATIGGSAAGGAVLGRVLSKKKSKGTAIGAIVGAAIGTAVASRNAGDPVVIEPGTRAEVRLEIPIHVTVEEGKI